MSVTAIETTERAAQPLEPTTAANGSGLLQLIEKVVSNPEISVEKVQALLNMQIELENRNAEKEFDRALVAAQTEIRALAWDKFNQTNQSRNVSYPKIEAMLKPIREKYGFVQSYDTEPHPTPDWMFFCCDVAHIGGFRRRYRLPMPIDGTGPKGGGVMTKCQAVGNGTSYSMRYLDKMIWNIPMLVDKDDNDGNTAVVTITKEQLDELKALAKETKSSIPKFCAYFHVDKIENLPASLYESAVTAFKKKGAEIAHKQASRSPLQPAPNGQAIEAATVKTLTSKMELAALSIGDFRKRFGLTKVEQINRKDINVVLGWIIDPQNA